MAKQMTYIYFKNIYPATQILGISIRVKMVI